MSFAFLPLYTGDYRRDTQHLSMMEHGAYCLLLMHCWDQRGPLPLDERRIFGICNARSNEEMGAVRHVLAEFFTRMDDGWYNRRMDREINRAAALSERLSTAGKAGARKRKSMMRQGLSTDAKPGLSQGSANAKPLLHTPTTTLTTTTRKNTPKAPVLPDGFGVFWSAYPHFPQRSSRAEALRRWNAMKLEPITDDVMRALKACLEIPQWTRDGRSFVSAAEVWLRKRLWEQELATMSDSLIESIANDPRCK
jgi:uncharacterized protein YdaU (DUF1376 family)